MGYHMEQNSMALIWRSQNKAYPHIDLEYTVWMRGLESGRNSN